MGTRVRNVYSDETKSVKTTQPGEKNAKLVFSFAQFTLCPINLKGQFNNYFKDEEDYVAKLSVLLGKALPMLSKEDETIFVENSPKAKALHLHKVRYREELVQEILEAYHFPQDEIDNIIEGGQIYQLELPFADKATRIVFNRIDNLISFLFVDPNHHIYLKREIVEQEGSLFFEHCPVYQDEECIRMNYLNTCFAFEFLDEKKFEETYGNSFTSVSFL